MLTKHKVKSKYSDDEYINMVMHQMERFFNVNKLTPVNKVLLGEMILSIFQEWFKDWEERANNEFGD